MGITNTSQTILDQLSAGETERFASLYAPHIGRMARRCMGCTAVPPADHEDVVQSVMATVLERAPLCFTSYDRLKARFKSWLKGMVFNVTFEEVRKLRKYRDRTGMECVLEVLADDFEESEDREFLQAQLEEAFLLLGDPDVVRILRLRVVEEKTWEEIAAEGDVSSGTLRKRASRACESLRELLSQNQRLLRAYPFIAEHATRARR